MIYTFLLSELLKTECKTYWVDAVFIIYFTYYTGFNHNSWNDLDYATLNIVSNREEGMEKSKLQRGIS
jgi:hypothetical protein